MNLIFLAALLSGPLQPTSPSNFGGVPPAMAQVSAAVLGPSIDLSDDRDDAAAAIHAAAERPPPETMLGENRPEPVAAVAEGR